MEDLVKKTSLVGHLGVLEDNNIVIISKVWPKNMTDSIAMVSTIGGVVPPHCTGVGKVLLAYSSEEQREKILSKCDFKKYTENTITSRLELDKVLNTIKINGYGRNNEEHEPYLSCLTYPIFDLNNEIAGTLSLTGLNQVFEQIDFNYIHKELKETTLKISKELGY